MKFFCIVFLFAFLPVSAQNADISMLRKIHADSSIVFDKTFKFISKSVTPVSIGTPVSMVLAGFINKDEQLKRNGYKTGISLLLASSLSTSLKFAINRKRPYVTYPDFIHKKSNQGPQSFPSGHTTAAFATATSLSLSCPKWYVIVPAYIYAGSTAYSRMYLGVHYPSDVLGGIVIGVGSSLLVWKLDKMINK